MTSPDVLISLLILSAVAIAVFIGRRGGAQNPVGTGKLQRDISSLNTRVTSLDTSLKGVVNKVAKIEEDMEHLPSAADLKVLSTDIAAVRRELGLVANAGDRTEQAVVRIEQLLLDRALPSSSGRRSR